MRLTEVIIPAGVTNIERLAFSGCSGLTNIVIPAGVISIELNTFNGCTNLPPSILSLVASKTKTKPMMLPGRSRGQISRRMPQKNALTQGDYTYTVTAGQATITDFNTSYSGALSITNTLGGCPVTSIGTSAFGFCSKLISVTIPGSVTNIGSFAFSSCTGLSSVTIPSSVTSIGFNAFQNCTNLPPETLSRLAALSLTRRQPSRDSKSNAERLREQAADKKLQEHLKSSPARPHHVKPSDARKRRH